MVRPSSAGSATLSTAVRFESRLGNWKTKPMLRERTVAADDGDKLAFGQLEARAAHGFVAVRAAISLAYAMCGESHRASDRISAKGAMRRARHAGSAAPRRPSSADNASAASAPISNTAVDGQVNGTPMTSK